MNKRAMTEAEVREYAHIFTAGGETFVAKQKPEMLRVEYESEVMAIYRDGSGHLQVPWNGTREGFTISTQTEIALREMFLAQEQEEREGKK